MAKVRITVRPQPGSGVPYVEAKAGRTGTVPFYREAIFEGDYEVDIEELADYVQVQVSGASPTYPWTYIDPSGELEVGDRVLVPFGYDDAERVAKVIALGKGSVPAGVRIKPVNARLEVEELV